MATENLSRLLRHFPASAYSFAYGSAVFPQKNQKIGKMMDLIFVVDNPIKWHAENIHRNSRHYSFLKYFGSTRLVKITDNWAAGVYYNTLVKIDDQMIKYGVISTQAFIDDLKHWTHCYISGRLHKPVLDLSPPNNSQLVKCIKQNRLSALRTVLLQLPTQSRKWDLYHGITELSYFGDSRMRFGENPNKVSNILAGNVARFDEIYHPLIQELSPLIKGSSNMENIVHDTSSSARLNHLLHLPFHLQRCICRESGRDPALHDVEEVLVEISSLPMLDALVRKALGNIVWKSSLRQTAQGILTAGPFKAVHYGLEKIGKKISGSRESKSLSLTDSLKTTSDIVPLEAYEEVIPAKVQESEVISKPLVLSSPSPPPPPVTKSDQSVTDTTPTPRSTLNLSDLDFPFQLKRSAQEPEEEKGTQGLITVKVKDQDKEGLHVKAQIRRTPILEELQETNSKKTKHNVTAINNSLKNVTTPGEVKGQSSSKVSNNSKVS